MSFVYVNDIETIYRSHGLFKTKPRAGYLRMERMPCLFRKVKIEYFCKKIFNFYAYVSIDYDTMNTQITPKPISGLLRYNPYSIHMQRCETADSIGLFACDFGLLIQKKSPNEPSISSPKVPF